MTKEEIIPSGLLELYVLGIATSEERKMVMDFLVADPELNEEVASIEASLIHYAEDQSPAPDSTLRDKIFSQIKNEEQDIAPTVKKQAITRNIFQIPFIYKLVAAAMLIFFIESVVLNYSFYKKYKKSSTELSLANQKLNQQEKYNETVTSEMNVMTDKHALPVMLNGTPKSPDAVAKIFWMKNTGEVYIDPTNLPAVPAGKQYQLWAIVDGKPQDGGMITTQKGVYHIQKMKTFGKAEAFAITLEKAGGSPTPTLDEMIVQAKM